ncbi:P-loop containing nucleoside triphosphate hydrolase protein [Naviculisporaceae sp. PSN 640]
MYSRYIPPPKGGATSNTPSYQATNAYHNSLQPSRQDEAKAPVTTKITFDDDYTVPTALTNGSTGTDIHPSAKTGRNGKGDKNSTKYSEEGVEEKPKDSKKRKRKTTDDQEEDAVDEAPGAPEDARKPPKKEKKKKKAKDMDPEQEDIDGVDEVHKRHKAVFEKVGRSLQKPVKDLSEDEKSEEKEEVHDLGPIPQPEPVVFDESKLTYDTLPPWLSSPIRVTRETRCGFSDLGIPPKSIDILQTKGFQDAFAVQAVAIPLLTPGLDKQGDVVISAPTGSGKTLSYVLPMVRDISQGQVTRLRAVIVLPTRDLVQQVQATCEACAAAFAVNKRKRVKIGTAVGNKPFKVEQQKLMKEVQKNDPEGYLKSLDQSLKLVSLDSSDDEEYGLGGDGFGAARPILDHVVERAPDVDILICTPGRLVEHITKTKGFTLDYVRWLVVDEADKLLAQDYQQWLDLVLAGLSVKNPSYRDFPNSNKTGPRKVILSATMTRDLSLLNGLKLSRPRLVVLEGTKSGEHLLPSSLKEVAIKVRDPALKPLYLVDLLWHINQSSPVETTKEVKEEKKAESGSDSDSESESDSDSDSSSESESESDSASSSDSSSDSDSDSETVPKKKSTQTKLASSKFHTTVLIFTKSNQAALRLSRLLAILAPELAPLIGTLTSSTKTSKRANILSEFARGKQIRILVASDLVSRGIDLTNLDHVVNYDLPINQTSYVHRVGRTARAGRTGHAWTMYDYSQGRRFWRDFVGLGEGASTDIIRAGKVEKLEIGGVKDEDGDVEMADGDSNSKKSVFSEERIKAYEAALEQLGKEARG